jgi:RNA polymerase sigma-70 factor (ECF subfamily)
MRESPDTRPSLLIRLRDPNDERAWGEFLDIYTPLIHRLARQAGLQGADADDLAQEVFGAVASAIDRWDPDPARGSFRGWLFRIARNMVINLLAARRRQPIAAGNTEVRRLLEQQPASSPDPTASFDEEYRRGLFRWAVKRVRGEFRESTWLAFWRTAVEGQKPQEVAESLGLTAGAVYVYRNRVVARIRRAIEDVEGGSAPDPTSYERQ